MPGTCADHLRMVGNWGSGGGTITVGADEAWSDVEDSEAAAGAEVAEVEAMD